MAQMKPTVIMVKKIKGQIPPIMAATVITAATVMGMAVATAAAMEEEAVNNAFR